MLRPTSVLLLVLACTASLAVAIPTHVQKAREIQKALRVLEAPHPSAFDHLPESLIETEVWLSERDCPRYCDKSCECLEAKRRSCHVSCSRCLSQGVPCGTMIKKKPEAPKQAPAPATPRFQQVKGKQQEPPTPVTPPAAAPAAATPAATPTPSEESSSLVEELKKDKAKIAELEKKVAQDHRDEAVKDATINQEKVELAQVEAAEKREEDAEKELHRELENKKRKDMGQPPVEAESKSEDKETPNKEEDHPSPSSSSSSSSSVDARIEKILAMQERIMDILRLSATPQQAPVEPLLHDPREVLPPQLFHHRLYGAMNTPLELYGDHGFDGGAVQPDRHGDAVHNLVGNLEELVSWVRRRKAHVGSHYGSLAHVNEVIDRAVQIARASE